MLARLLVRNELKKGRKIDLPRSALRMSLFDAIVE